MQKERITQDDWVSGCIRQIEERRLPSGGFSEKAGGLYRPDSTAWAALALSAHSSSSSSAESGRAALAASQQKDGRVALPASPEAYWPTALAILAWDEATGYDEAKDRAVKFLLRTSGSHFAFDPRSVISHDTSIKGWSWIGGTHSFVDPTAIALIALDITGQAKHERFTEGVRMIMNRQLSGGGWNYGNTRVYGKELRPFVETTGVAIASLAGHVAREAIAVSLNYLNLEAERIRTPLSLGWALIGMGAWKEFPNAGLDWIAETIDKQKIYGAYGTSLLSLLLFAGFSRGDLKRDLVRSRERRR